MMEAETTYPTLEKEEAPTAVANPTPGLCSRFCQELRICSSRPWFSVSELDVPRSFAPRDPLSIGVKVVVTGVTVGIFAYAWTQSRYPPLLMGFLTQWAYATLCLYTCLSLFNSLWGVVEKNDTVRTTASLRVRAQWVLFELGLHLTVLASGGFYAFLLELGDIKFIDIAQHGGVAPLILLEGLVVNRIPIHMTHYVGIVIPVELLYVLWSYIHSLTDIGNPGISTSDSLYPGLLEWTSELWTTTIFLAVLIAFVFGPIAYLLMWFCFNGACCCKSDVRRRQDKGISNVTDQQVPADSDVENGHTPPKESSDASDEF